MNESFTIVEADGAPFFTVSKGEKKTYPERIGPFSSSVEAELFMQSLGQVYGSWKLCYVTHPAKLTP